ncbi:MAG: hypothetical protein M1834_004253 [Cirrosporium novae-zelandiae]|nr:MAG: hypothetical protein M1834_004253 [Cirrosporium novae-zelandiae]
MAKDWSDAELIVLIFWISRGVYHETCAHLINQKCGQSRTIVGLRDRLRRLREGFPEIGHHNHWNIEAVDNWVQSRGLGRMEVEQLVSYTEEAQRIIAEHQNENDIREIYQQYPLQEDSRG